MMQTPSAEVYRLASSFENVKQTLQEKRFSERLTKPLGYWVLPNDRRLPIAFLNRSLGEILQTPFEDLSSTPGIGQKKIGSLVNLLRRAINDEPPEPNGDSSGAKAEEGFDPSIVSEARWSQWCTAIKKFNIGEEKLGWLSPSLENLPTVIWETPLGRYQDHTVAEIRNMRTHGEKRVRCIWEIFHAVYENTLECKNKQELLRRLTPAFVNPLNQWIKDVKTRNDIPTPDEVRTSFSVPILNQILIDCGETVHAVAKARLGIGTNGSSVRKQAQEMGVTRARIYQLLDDCGRVMDVRWPEGRKLLDETALKMQARGNPKNISLALFFATKQLCFPDRADERP
jgi:hypothetical protein